MSNETPFGTLKFRLYGTGFDISPDKHCIVKPVDESETELLESIFDGTSWIRTVKGSRSWEITIHNISYSEYFTNILISKGKLGNFIPHIDRLDLDYDVLITFVTHSYEQKDYFKDEAIIKLTERVYR
jgi:hypothetical protein